MKPLHTYVPAHSPIVQVNAKPQKSAHYPKKVNAGANIVSVVKFSSRPSPTHVFPELYSGEFVELVQAGVRVSHKVLVADQKVAIY